MDVLDFGKPNVPPKVRPASMLESAFLNRDGVSMLPNVYDYPFRSETNAFGCSPCNQDLENELLFPQTSTDKAYAAKKLAKDKEYAQLYANAGSEIVPFGKLPDLPVHSMSSFESSRKAPARNGSSEGYYKDPLLASLGETEKYNLRRALGDVNPSQQIEPYYVDPLLSALSDEAARDTAARGKVDEDYSRYERFNGRKWNSGLAAAQRAMYEPQYIDVVELKQALLISTFITAFLVVVLAIAIIGWVVLSKRLAYREKVSRFTSQQQGIAASPKEEKAPSVKEQQEDSLYV